MHKEFLEGLRRVGSVKLVAKYKNDKIGFPFSDKMRILVPDFHLFSKYSYEKNRFSSRTNYIDDLLPSLVRYLAEFKQDSQQAAKEVIVYHQGDFLDPWRETPEYWSKDPGKYDEAVNRIIESCAPIWDEMTDTDTINAHFVLGNHDFDIHRVAGLSDQFSFLRLFFDGEGGKTVAAVMHGDLFAWVEKAAPDWIKQLAVYYLSPKELQEKKPELLAEVKKQADQSAQEDVKRDNVYVEAHLGDLIDPDEAPEDEWNVKRPGKAVDKDLTYLDPAKKYYEKVNRELNYDIRTAFIGHTHHARIAVYDDRVEGNDTFFLLVDSGAWVRHLTANYEKNGQTEQITEKNAQVGVLCNNEARIYQLSKK